MGRVSELNDGLWAVVTKFVSMGVSRESMAGPKRWMGGEASRECASFVWRI